MLQHVIITFKDQRENLQMTEYVVSCTYKTIEYM